MINALSTPTDTDTEMASAAVIKKPAVPAPPPPPQIAPAANYGGSTMPAPSAAATPAAAPPPIDPLAFQPTATAGQGGESQMPAGGLPGAAPNNAGGLDATAGQGLPSQGGTGAYSTPDNWYPGQPTAPAGGLPGMAPQSGIDAPPSTYNPSDWTGGNGVPMTAAQLKQRQDIAAMTPEQRAAEMARLNAQYGGQTIDTTGAMAPQFQRPGVSSSSTLPEDAMRFQNQGDYQRWYYLNQLDTAQNGYNNGQGGNPSMVSYLTSPEYVSGAPQSGISPLLQQGMDNAPPPLPPPPDPGFRSIQGGNYVDKNGKVLGPANGPGAVPGGSTATSLANRFAGGPGNASDVGANGSTMNPAGASGSSAVPGVRAFTPGNANDVGQGSTPTSGYSSALGGAAAGAPTGGNTPSSNASAGLSPQMSAVDPNNDLRSQQITPGDFLDRFKLATQQFGTYADSTNPQFEASLRDATRAGAGAGRLGSGMLRTSYGDLANQRAGQLTNERDSLFQNALSGSVGDAQTKFQDLMAEQAYQTGAQNQDFNQNVTGQQLQDQLTNSSFSRALQQMNAGNAGNPSGALDFLAQLFQGQSSDASAALAKLIGNTTANNAGNGASGSGGTDYSALFKQYLDSMGGSGSPPLNTNQPDTQGSE